MGSCGDVLAKPRYSRQPVPSASLRGALADQPFPPDGQIVRVPPGAYSLRVSAPYYRMFEIRRLQVRPNTLTTIEDLILLPECLPGKACPPIRKSLQKSTRSAIFL